LVLCVLQLVCNNAGGGILRKRKLHFDSMPNGGGVLTE
jgi:hypothetical protein